MQARRVAGFLHKLQPMKKKFFHSDVSTCRESVIENLLPALIPMLGATEDLACEPVGSRNNHVLLVFLDGWMMNDANTHTSHKAKER